MLLPKNSLAAAASTALPDGAPTKDWLQSHAMANAEAYVIAVTPKMATCWLKQNTLGDVGNRRFRKNHANSIAEEMRRGEWRLTHQGIAFGTSGRLLDGQHRLWAIIESGTTQLMLVFIDVPEEKFANYDRGAMRGIADILIRDAKSASLGTTMVRLTTRGAFGSGRKPVPSEVEKALTVFAADIQALKEASSTDRMGRTLAPIKVAWLIHYHGASDAGKDTLRQQWKAFADYDPRHMDDSTAAGDKRLEHFRTLRGGSLEIEAACIGWLMFDPERRNLTRIIIKNTSTAMDEMRAAMRLIIPELMPVDAPADKIVAPKMTERVYPFSDPEIGPILRAKAMAAIAAKKALSAAAD